MTEPPDAPPPVFGPPPGWVPPPGYVPPPGWVPPPPGAGRSDDGVWSVLSHLSFFVLAIFAPLIIMMTVGKTSPYVRHHAVEALNFHITFCLAMLVSGILILVFIGIPMLFAVGITGVVFTILASVAAGRGEWYRYPISWRLVR